MSNINADVTGGYTFVVDGEGRVKLTKDRLNLLGVPTVVVAIDDAIDTEDIKDDAVTVAKLSNALADLIPQITLTGTDDADGTGSMAIQVKDAKAEALAQRFLLRCWIADADFSEPDAQTDFSVLTGEQMREIEANADYEVITTADGACSMNIDAGGAKTVFVMVELDGRIYSAQLDITA
jgi:hypothetical protein